MNRILCLGRYRFVLHLAEKGYQNWYYGKHSIFASKAKVRKDEKYLSNFYGAMQIFIEKGYKKQSPLQYQF